MSKTINAKKKGRRELGLSSRSKYLLGIRICVNGDVLYSYMAIVKERLRASRHFNTSKRDSVLGVFGRGSSREVYTMAVLSTLLGFYLLVKCFNILSSTLFCAFFFSSFFLYLDFYATVDTEHSLCKFSKGYRKLLNCSKLYVNIP